MLRSAAESIVWPAAMSGRSAELMAVVAQLRDTEWWSTARLEGAQLLQLGQLTAHAALLPFHSGRMRECGLDPSAPDWAAWQRLQPMTREDLRASGAELLAAAPASHGSTGTASSGGSTGKPVTVTKTSIDALFMNAISIRERYWHTGGPGQGRMARIRGSGSMSEGMQGRLRSKEGFTSESWGAPSEVLCDTGPILMVDNSLPVEAQEKFLIDFAPDFLMTTPSNLRVLLKNFERSRKTLPSLKKIFTLAEVLDDSTREACYRILGVGIADSYSSEETGYIAVQCPAFPHNLHVQSETILVEVVGPGNLPVPPGSVGRVLLTPLHNFAMPLLRYEVGDEAEVGQPCSCGRGLPTLRRVIGRTTDYLTMADGQTRRCAFSHWDIGKVSRVLEFQIVQRSLDWVEAVVATSEPLDAREQRAILKSMDRRFGPEFHYTILGVDSIERTGRGKLRNFISEIDGAGV